MELIGFEIKPELLSENRVIVLNLGNVVCEILNCRSDIVRAISDILSYEPDGAAHQMRHLPKWSTWDGRTRLLKKNKFPSGLLFLVEDFLKENKLEYKIADSRKRPKTTKNFKATFPYTLRPYQNEVRTIVKRDERGVFDVGTGGGKACLIGICISEIGLDTLVVVPDVGLREQLYQSLVKWFSKELVSKDIKSNASIVVHNIAGLVNKPEALFYRFKSILSDEFHHSSASTYLKLNILAKNAFYRYGFTGTNVRPDGKDLVMQGVNSKVLLKKSTSDLIEEGYLVPPHIKMKFVSLHGYSRLGYREAYDRLVADDEVNNLIAKEAEDLIEEGLQVLILVRRKAHGEAIVKRLPFAKVAYLTGDDLIDVREQAKDSFKNREIQCLIATSIFREGQDIPAIDAFVNARFQKSVVETKQGIGRALRLAEGAKNFSESQKLGKSCAKVVDFFFKGNRHLQNHSVERAKQYRSERAFIVKVEKV